MKSGTMDLALVPDTPKTLRDVLQPFGHIVICEARVDPRVMLDADILGSVALYVGVLRRLPTPFQLSGAGLLIWLGDEEGKGFQPPLANAYTQTTATFVTWVNYIVAGAITPGTVTATGGTLTYTAPLQSTQRAVLDTVTQQFSAEYKVKNNGTLDAGPSANLYATTPTVIAMPREGGREVGGLVGIAPTSFDLETDADSYSTSVILVGATGKAQATGAATTYKDIHGGTATLVRVVTNSAVTAGLEATAAAAEVLKYPLRQVVTLTTDRFNIVHDVRAGDWLYVYDPEHDLVDLTNPQHYRGQIVYPVKLRVYALTWPVEVGMSVYYRDGNGVYTDLTNWVAFESPGTSFELGAANRGLTVP